MTDGLLKRFGAYRGVCTHPGTQASKIAFLTSFRLLFALGLFVLS